MFHSIYHAIAWTWSGDNQGGPEGEGYLITSGPLPASAVIGGLLVWFFNKKCEEPKCWRISKKEDRSGHDVCRKHYRMGLPKPAYDAIDEIKTMNRDHRKNNSNRSKSNINQK